MKLLNLMCNTRISEDDLVREMGGRLIVVDNNWFIPKFLKFQYASLNSNRPVIISVVKELEKNNLISMIPESFGNDYKIIKDKDKDKDKDVFNSKNEKNGKFSGNFKAQSEELFAQRFARHRTNDSGGKKDL